MDGTEKPKGLSSEGQTSEGETQGTSKPKTYTEDEVNKAKSDALAAAGRDAKTLAEREASLKALEESLKGRDAEIAEWQRRKDEAELDEARRDPTKLSEYQKRKAREKEQDDLKAEREALRKDRAALERDKAEHAEALKAAQETQLEIELWEIAAEKGINAVTLKDSMKRLNLTTVEQAKELAKTISETAQRPAGSEKPLEVDSGVTSGGGKLTNEQLDKLSMDDYAAHRKKETSS